MGTRGAKGGCASRSEPSKSIGKGAQQDRDNVNDTGIGGVAMLNVRGALGRSELTLCFILWCRQAVMLLVAERTTRP